MTDRQTDRQTDAGRQQRPRLHIASRGKKNCQRCGVALSSHLRLLSCCILAIYQRALVCLRCWRATERTQRKQQHLWEFLLETLSNPKYNPCYIEWLDRPRGIFRFVESHKVARLWGQRRKKDNMSYEYFSRAMRSFVTAYFYC